MAAACPYDTNGDGDCGKRLCPYCGDPRLRQPSDQLFTAVEHPTDLQAVWEMLFRILWRHTQRHGRQAGATWFWAKVIRFIVNTDPSVLDRLDINLRARLGARTGGRPE